MTSCTGSLISMFGTRMCGQTLLFIVIANDAIHLPSAHHSHPPSHVHYFIPRSKFTFSTNLFHHSLLAPTRTDFSDYTGPDLLCSMVFIFLVIFLSFYFGLCGRLSWLNCQLSSAASSHYITLHHCNITSLFDRTSNISRDITFPVVGLL